MTKQYKALKPVGRFKEGDLVGGINDAQIKQLIADGTIQEVPEEVKATTPAKKAVTGDEK